MRKTFLPAFIFLFVACNKEPVAVSTLQLRVNNKTNQNFEEVLTNGGGFFNINAHSTSSYQTYSQILSVPSCTLISGSDTSRVGLIVIDYPTYITEGKYTLEIKTDTLTAAGYSCEYKED